MDSLQSLIERSQRLVCDENYFKTSYKEQLPPSCSCFRFGKRNLSWLPQAPNLSGSRLLDRFNIEPIHEHGRFDINGRNIGFGPDGVFEENVGQYHYVWDDTCYDAHRMAEAIAAIESPSDSYSVLGTRRLPKFNCQDFTQRLRGIYHDLLGN